MLELNGRNSASRRATNRKAAAFEIDARLELEVSLSMRENNRKLCKKKGRSSTQLKELSLRMLMTRRYKALLMGRHPSFGSARHLDGFILEG